MLTTLSLKSRKGLYSKLSRKSLYIHVGYPKCGSTSLQAALIKAKGITYPLAGRNAEEHLSLPLFLKGVDSWTTKWFSEEWVAEQHAAMMQEIAAAPGDVFLSSERLVALNPGEIVALRDLFPDWRIEIIIVERSLEKYLDSTWRHAVYRHDYAESKATFLKKMAGFTFGKADTLFGKYFPVHVFNMEHPDYTAAFAKATGVTISLGRANVGVSNDLAVLLQQTHALMGSARFKAAFTQQVKEAMRAALADEVTPNIDSFDVPLF